MGTGWMAHPGPALATPGTPAARATAAATLANSLFMIFPLQWETGLMRATCHAQRGFTGLTFSPAATSGPAASKDITVGSYVMPGSHIGKPLAKHEG